MTPTPPGELQGHQLRVLIAEDNPSIQLLGIEILRRLGHEDVEVVSNGREAVESFRERAFDVILMDMRMPVMDGLEATREIRRIAHGSSGPFIIALTANALESDRQACRAAGMDEHLSKPFDPARLGELLGSVERR